MFCPPYFQQLRNNYLAASRAIQLSHQGRAEVKIFLTILTSGKSPFPPAKLVTHEHVLYQMDNFSKSCSENILEKTLRVFLYLHFKIFLALICRDLNDLMSLNFSYLLHLAAHGAHFVHWSFSRCIWALGSPREKHRLGWLSVHIVVSPESCIQVWMVQLKEEKRK